MNHAHNPETPFPLSENGQGGPAPGSFGLWPPPPSLPIPNLPPTSGLHGAPPPGYSEAYGRAQFLAFRFGNILVIQAEGVLRNANQIPDIRQSPLKIYPPQFDFLVYTPHISLPALAPFKFSEVFGFPADAPVVVVHDADGHHAIKIQEIVSKGLPPLAARNAGDPVEETGYGRTFEEAFAAAVALLPVSAPETADSLARYRLTESGLLRGGVAGIDLHYAKAEVIFS